jgi:hypothetical protein
MRTDAAQCRNRLQFREAPHRSEQLDRQGRATADTEESGDNKGSRLAKYGASCVLGRKSPD